MRQFFTLCELPCSSFVFLFSPSISPRPFRSVFLLLLFLFCRASGDSLSFLHFPLHFVFLFLILCRCQIFLGFFSSAHSRFFFFWIFQGILFLCIYIIVRFGFLELEIHCFFKKNFLQFVSDFLLIFQTNLTFFSFIRIPKFHIIFDIDLHLFSTFLPVHLFVWFVCVCARVLLRVFPRLVGFYARSLRLPRCFLFLFASGPQQHCPINALCGKMWEWSGGRNREGETEKCRDKVWKTWNKWEILREKRPEKYRGKVRNEREKWGKMKRNNIEKYVVREVRNSVGKYETEGKEKKKLDRETRSQSRLSPIFIILFVNFLFLYCLSFPHSLNFFNIFNFLLFLCCLSNFSLV